jgi:hypothetical protein
MDIDVTIRELFRKLDERKAKVAEVRKATQKGWVTNGTWKVPFTATVINIQTLPEDQLYLVAGHIMMTFTADYNGRRIVGGPEEKKVQGYDIDEWSADLRKRKAMIEIRSEEAKLAELETRLNSVLSPEDRRRIEVELLAKDL